MLKLHKKPFFFILHLLIFVIPAFSDSGKSTPLLDSLRLKLNGKLPDTTRFDVLKKIGEMYSDQHKDTSVYFFKKAAALASKIKDRLREGEAYRMISRYYSSNKKFIESYNWLTKLEEIQQNSADTTLLLKTLFTKTELYRELNQLPRVAELLGERIKIYHHQRDTLSEIKTYYVKGWTEFNAKLFREGISDLNKGKILTEKTVIKKNLREMLLWTGACYNGLKVFDSALFYQKKVLEIDIRIKDTFHLGEVHRYTGDIYYKMGDFNMALDYYEKSIRYFLMARNKWRANLLLTYKVRTLDSLKRYKEAASELTRLFNDPDLIKDNYVWLLANEAGKDVYYKSGDLIKAIICFREYEKLNKAAQLDDAHQEILIAEFKKEQEKDKALQEAKQKENDAVVQFENQKQKTIRNSLIAGVIFIALFALSVYISLRKNKKAGKIISLQKEQLQEKNKEIIDSIHYAKRIQNALITSELYIEKTIKRLNRP